MNHSTKLINNNIRRRFYNFKSSLKVIGNHKTQPHYGKPYVTVHQKLLYVGCQIWYYMSTTYYATLPSLEQGAREHPLRIEAGPPARGVVPGKRIIL